MNPEGWLIEPNNKWLLKFQEDTQSHRSIAVVYIESGKF